MTKFFAKLSGALTAVTLLAATPVLAQDINEWDSDGDGAINQEEFDAGWGERDVYGTWDEDGDGSLTEDEFNSGVYDSYDADDSGAIEEPEFGDLGDDMGDGGFWDV